MIKTIDLSPGLRMHLEINTHGRARTLERMLFPGVGNARFPMIISPVRPMLDAHAFALFAIRENPRLFNSRRKRVRRLEMKVL